MQERNDKEIKVGNQVAYLSLGSNLGDRAASLLRATTAIITGNLHMIAASSIYETDPVDYPDQPQFLNMVVAAAGESLDPFSLLGFCQEIEKRLGRDRSVPKASRTIDIDLLMFDDLIVDGRRGTVDLILPHPRMHLRRFVLTPMAEIVPNLKHPVMGKTIANLLDSLGDQSVVRIYRE